MKKTFLIFLLLPCAVAGVQFISCRKPVPPDPCAGLKPVSADFNVYQKFREFDSLFTIDTIIMVPNKNLYIKEIVGFRANEVNATYKWELEDYAENPIESKSFTLGFDQPHGKIDVKLTVKKEPNLSCFPQDDGTDEVTKSLYLLDGHKFKYAFEGTFTGCLTDNPNDIFDITIVNFGKRPANVPYDAGYYGVRVYNLPKGCGRKDFSQAEYTPEIGERTYRSFQVVYGTNGFPCGGFYTGLGKVYANNNKITITFIDYDIKQKKLAPTGNQFIGNRKK